LDERIDPEDWQIMTVMNGRPTGLAWRDAPRHAGQAPGNARRRRPHEQVRGKRVYCCAPGQPAQQAGIRSMNARKTLLVAAALCVVATALQAAQPKADSSAGTWKLNVAKSSFAQNPAPTSATRVYTVTAEGTRLVIEEEFADGRKTRVDTRITYDGKPHAVTNRDYDSIASKRVNSNETLADLLLNGKVIGSLRREVSADGKTMKINYLIHKPDGTTVSSVSVYDRQ
jgi:hypothetical protein